MRMTSKTNPLLCMFLLSTFSIASPACDAPGTSQTGLPIICPDGMHMHLPVDVPRTKVDILVLVDNSMSMGEEQANLASNFPFLIHSLLDPEVDPATGSPVHDPVADMHIGVISLDMGSGGYEVETCRDPVDGDDGRLLHAPSPSISGCDDRYPLFLSYESEEPDPDRIDWMSVGFGCIAVLGLRGCGWEQPLKALARALVDHRDGANAGFQRDDSLLVVVVLTEEGDYSVAPGHEYIFDPTDESLGHLNLRCFRHPEVLVPVEEYVDIFEGLRADPDDLLFGFIMGVPKDEMCEGSGNEIPFCLAHPDMIERLDPVSGTRLIPSCLHSTGEAYAPPRLVRVAQSLGDGALVQSICTNDFRPAIENLTAKVVERLTSEPNDVPLPVERDDSDPCTCRTSCTLVEQRPGPGPCPAEKPCHEPGGPGSGCALEEDESGVQHALCTIPQVDTILDDCSLGCERPGNAHRAGVEQGWYYLVNAAGPRIAFTGGILPDSGSSTYLSCCY